jgi:DNA-binding transcriptional LysR family regulator
VRVRGHLLLDNGDVAVEVILAGVGIGVVPEFLVWKALREGRLKELLLPWAAPPIALHIVTPPNTVRSARVRVLTEFLAQHFTRAPWARPDFDETT